MLEVAGCYGYAAGRHSGAAAVPRSRAPREHGDRARRRSTARRRTRRSKPTIRPTTGAALLPVAVARAIAFVALAAWGVLHWMSMLEPAEPGRGWTALLVGTARDRGDARRRHGSMAAGVTLAAVGAIVPLTALMLLSGRVGRRAAAARRLGRAGRRHLARHLRPAGRARALPRPRRLGADRDPARRQRARPRRRAAGVLAAARAPRLPGPGADPARRALRRAGRRAGLRRSSSCAARSSRC